MTDTSPEKTTSKPQEGTPPPAYPDYCLSPNAVFQDKGVVWRYGKPPDYLKTRNTWKEGKNSTHVAGSLPSLVENLVKNWEVEASFKPRLQDWRTIDHNKYSFAMNGGTPQSAEHMLKVGTYNAIICPNQYYSPENSDFASSHKTFKRMMPTFAWEVIEVYSEPPTVAFKWRHWGVMKNDYVGFNDKGERVTAKAHGGPIEIFGVTVAKVNKQLQLQAIDTYMDPLAMFQQIAPQGVVNKEIMNRKVDKTEALDVGADYEKSTAPAENGRPVCEINLSQRNDADPGHAAPEPSHDTVCREENISPLQTMNESRNENTAQLESTVESPVGVCPFAAQVAAQHDSDTAMELMIIHRTPESSALSSVPEIELTADVMGSHTETLLPEYLPPVIRSESMDVEETAQPRTLVASGMDIDHAENLPTTGMAAITGDPTAELEQAQRSEGKRTYTQMETESTANANSTAIAGSKIEEYQGEQGKPIDTDIEIGMTEQAATSGIPRSIYSSAITGDVEDTIKIGRGSEALSEPSAKRACNDASNASQREAIHSDVIDEPVAPGAYDEIDQHLAKPAAEIHPHAKGIEEAVKPDAGEAVAVPADSQEARLTYDEMSTVDPKEAESIMNRE